MKNLALTVLLVLGSAVLALADPLPYDSGVVKDLMHTNMDQVKAIKKALSDNDFTSVGNAFIILAQNAEKALAYAPPKGSQEEWNNVWNDVLTASFKGVGAAGAKDASQVKADLDLLLGDQRKGHGAFKG